MRKLTTAFFSALLFFSAHSTIFADDLDFLEDDLALLWAVQSDPDLAFALESSSDLDYALIANPDLSADIAANPELAWEIIENPELANMLVTHPELADELRIHPELAFDLRTRPEIVYDLESAFDLTASLELAFAADIDDTSFDSAYNVDSDALYYETLADQAFDEIKVFDIGSTSPPSLLGIGNYGDDSIF